MCCKHSIPSCLIFLVTLHWTVATTASDWPEFRGPLGNGHIVDSTIPVTWSDSENVTWKVDVPGRGHSSPVIADGKIWLTTAIVDELSEQDKQDRLAKITNSQGLEIVSSVSLRALCFDQQTGQEIHNVELLKPETLEPIHKTNTYASPTPVIYDGKVLFHFGTYGSACVDAKSGEVLWRNVGLKIEHQNGPGSSPIVWNGLMITHYDGTDLQFVAALDIKDGSVAWKTERSGALNPKPEMKKAYCTPTLVETARGIEMISPGADWVYGYDPKTGQELWKAAYGELGFSTVPKPVIGHGMAFICTSFMRSRLLAVKYGGTGDVTTANIVWASDSQISKKPSLMLVDQLLFVGNDSGIITCFEATTGKELWRERIGGNFSASPIYCNGLIYFFSEEGKTTVIRATDKYEPVANNQLGDGFTASPAVSGDSLFLRSQTALYRIDAKP
jgi:outer membrane protein assembly factor BamB